MTDHHERRAAELPAGLSKPARQALEHAGYTRLEQLAQITERELLQLHGMGPKSIPLLRQALAAKGLSFAERGR
ncbi:MAG: DNA-binding protein [Chloroflexota bacterium]|nr:DNA-binding protein [Chloroflexota bacterium]